MVVVDYILRDGMVDYILRDGMVDYILRDGRSRLYTITPLPFEVLAKLHSHLT
jgi:hypothetical protein